MPRSAFRINAFRASQSRALACTHGLFTGKAIELLRAQTDVDEIITTNTVPIRAEKRCPTCVSFQSRRCRSDPSQSRRQIRQFLVPKHLTNMNVPAWRRTEPHLDSGWGRE
jgi:hypothetical protein